jgi:hypothetical protein
MHNAKGKGGSSKRRMRKEGRAEGRKGSRSGIGLSGDDIKGIVCQLSYITQSHACSRFEERWKEDTGFILLFDREGRKSRNILLSWSVHLEKIYLDRLSYGPTDWVSLSLPLSFSLSFFLSLPLSLSLSLLLRDLEKLRGPKSALTYLILRLWLCLLSQSAASFKVTLEL